LVGNNLVASQDHVDEVISHVEDRVLTVDQFVLVIEETFEVM
jgi:hypothetical protein